MGLYREAQGMRNVLNSKAKVLRRGRESNSRIKVLQSFHSITQGAVFSVSDQEG